MSEQPSAPTNSTRFNRPPWLKVRMRMGDEFHQVDSVLKRLQLHAVCREAACPNIGTCFNDRTVTFLILGDTCTRHCGFCNVKHGTPSPWDHTEAERIVEGVKALGLEHVVITSVTRDDLSDGGASAFAETIEALKDSVNNVSVEVLIPDFKGSTKSILKVLNAQPDVVGHNVETVPRLYPVVRAHAHYDCSLSVLKAIKDVSSVVTKSGLMVGLGETIAEVYAVLDDLASHHCDIVTVGQYLAPTARNISVGTYYRPDEFDAFAREGLKKGIRWMESAPLVRSSFHAARQRQSLLGSHCGS